LAKGVNVPDPDLETLLDLADRAAARAGAALRAHRGDWSGVEAVQGREVKVQADKHAEDLILDMITRESDLPILSEEAGWVGAHMAGGVDRLAWAIDPLDGSVNYINGYPHCAVSIALMQGARPILGLVDCFMLGERFAGIVGRGATLNGAPIRVSNVDDPARGILNTGIPARAAVDAAAFRSFMDEMLSWRKVRMIGSAAAALAYVASGRADAYRESGAMLWDVAAGCALVEAAGGRARLVGAALDKPLVVAASNAALAERVGAVSPGA
jgi:myo-inositol-1(or 4)-monophosphatase